MSKKIIIIAVALVAVVVLALSLTGGNKKDENMTTLRVGTEGAYMPWNGMDSDGVIIGFEADLAVEICKKLGVTCEFVGQDWDGIIPALQHDKYDVIMAAMSITEERSKSIDFTEAYAADGVSIASLRLEKKDTLEEVIESLDGKTIGVQKGTVAAAFLSAKFPDLSINEYSTQDELNIDLLAGRIDAGANDTSVWYALKESQPELEVISPILTGAYDPALGKGIGIGVKKGREQLVNKLNKAIQELRQEGVLSKLAIKWFGYDTSF